MENDERKPFQHDWGCENESQIQTKYTYSFADAAKKAIDGEFDIAEVLSLVI